MIHTYEAVLEVEVAKRYRVCFVRRSLTRLAERELDAWLEAKANEYRYKNPSQIVRDGELIDTSISVWAGPNGAEAAEAAVS